MRATMRAMVLRTTGPIREGIDPLEPVELPAPTPGDSDVLVQVAACGVCHTELDEIEGRTPPPRLPVIPGHEVVGRVVGRGDRARRHELGDRVGIGWIHRSDGSETENLSEDFVATGRDVDGGYAEYIVVPERYAVPIPGSLGDAAAAPLLCAGAIGYRALRLTGLADGEPLGLTGFGASGHLVLPLARHLYPNSEVYVFARDPQDRAFAERLGALWAGDTRDRAPEPLRAIIDSTPAWTPVVEGLANLAPGGRLVINAIRKESTDREALDRLSYHEHLWMEREIKSVANITARDIEEFLPLAASIPLKPTVTTWPLERANEALRAVRRGERGAQVLVVRS